MERRLGASLEGLEDEGDSVGPSLPKAPVVKGAPLPLDYIKMVEEIFRTNFSDGLKALGLLAGAPTGAPAGAKMGSQASPKTGKLAHFVAQGMIYPDEIVLSVSLLQKDDIAATTVYASSDFDPRASSPTAEQLLAVCVDAIGAFFSEFLTSAHPKKLQALSDHTLAAFEEVAFEWTPLEVEKRRVYWKVDKSNPELDRLADDWLKKHDPLLKDRDLEEEEKAAAKFVTGRPRKPREEE